MTLNISKGRVAGLLILLVLCVSCEKMDKKHLSKQVEMDEELTTLKKTQAKQLEREKEIASQIDKLSKELSKLSRIDSEVTRTRNDFEVALKKLESLERVASQGSKSHKKAIQHLRDALLALDASVKEQAKLLEELEQRAQANIPTSKPPAVKKKKTKAELKKEMIQDLDDAGKSHEKGAVLFILEFYDRGEYRVGDVALNDAHSIWFLKEKILAYRKLCKQEATGK